MDLDIYLLRDNQIHQLTDNDVDDFEPDIHSNVVVWASEEDTINNITSIYYYDMVSIKKLAEVYNIFGSPVTSHGKVAWSGYDGNDWEIFLWENDSIVQITDRKNDDYQPVISDGVVAWSGYNGSQTVLYMWDGNFVSVQTSAGTLSWPYALDNGKMVWDNGGQVVFWDRFSVTKVADSRYTQQHPDINDNIVVWNSDNEIWMLKNDSVTQITNNNYVDKWPKVHNGMITWMRMFNAGFYQIMMWDGTKEHQITFKDIHHFGPVIWVEE